jgi:cystathionine beta-lyase
MNGFGAMLSFELYISNLSADEFMKNLQLIKPAVSLGGVETTICDSARTSHVKVSAEDRAMVYFVYRLALRMQKT